ncbi:ribonuclease J [Acetivibrio sp. MSJd-27]|nr:ribonuclease J [Acetivibrio sp. MSJd-27]MBU5449474.1 ribonuclease J [Acetivibrio sp. MSJd-27]
MLKNEYGGKNVVKNPKIKVIPLGGLNEIGKNLTVIESSKDIVVLDCGIAFPDEEMLGVDLVIPDISYLVKNKKKVRGIVLTHGHEDHIGALPYVLKDINVPVFGTKLTLGLVECKLKEHNLLSKVKLNKVVPGDRVKLGEITAEFIRTNHSIADAVAIAFHTPAGIILHTGDFKIDSTPVTGDMIDLARFGELGKQGVTLLMSDSTNAERPGYTMSEKTVGEAFDNIFKDHTKSRLIIATFASNIHRVQQIIDAAAKYGRKVAVSGRSMENVVRVAMELGYIKANKNVMIEIDDIKKYNKEHVVIITTGSQGEPMSALYRMAYSDHRKVEIKAGDVVVVSANPIPGNEKSISKVINELFRKGADVIYEALMDVHVSGHACQEELKLILGIVKPKYFMPVHGEYRHLMCHAQLAQKIGIPKSNVFISQIGKILEVTKEKVKFNGSVSSGRIFVDGLGVGDVGNIVLRDRKHLSQDGLIVIVVTVSHNITEVVAGPDVISRGFVYVRESEDLMDNVKNIAKETMEKCIAEGIKDWSSLKNEVRSNVFSYLSHATKRHPMILPVIMEV